MQIKIPLCSCMIDSEGHRRIQFKKIITIGGSNLGNLLTHGLYTAERNVHKIFEIRQMQQNVYSRGYVCFDKLHKRSLLTESYEQTGKSCQTRVLRTRVAHAPVSPLNMTKNE